MRKQALLCLVLGAGGGAGAEMVYVTDSLRLGPTPRPAPATSRSRTRQRHGRRGARARLELRPCALARRPRGLGQGDVPGRREPAAARVLELAERGGLENAAAAAKTAQVAAEQQLADFRGELQATTGSSESIKETIARLESDNVAYVERLEGYRHTLPLAWVLPAVVVALVAGFLVGLWWLDALIRRRHGGFRVY
jgi:hypothetical protein